MTNFHDVYRSRYDAISKQDFTDKESYLTWVRNWKDFYKELSQEIRTVKAHIKQRMRGDFPNEILSDMELWKVQYYREALRNHAVCALECRAQGKKDSWAMKLRNQELEKVS